MGKYCNKKGNYFVFHDESIPNKRWFLIGLLFVKDVYINNVLRTLHYYREKENYFGEIHFSKLPKNFDGRWGAKARTARMWLKAYEAILCEQAFFIGLVVDRHSPAYEHKRFSKHYHAYNRFTAMALKAGISWFLVPQDYDEVEITFISDAKDRLSRPDEGMIDNFEEYIPYRALLDSFLSWKKGKKYPFIRLNLKLEDSKNNDLLQLCDLLLGAIQTAIVGEASRPTKRELGSMIVQWCKDLHNPPWEQEYKLHRKFNLWAFPNHKGEPYNNIPFSLKINDKQLKIFKINNLSI